MLFFALFALIAAKPEVKRNNVIFILTDDLDKDMNGMVSLKGFSAILFLENLTYNNRSHWKKHGN